MSQQKLESEKRRAARNKRGEQSQDPTDHGIELQVLNGKSRFQLQNAERRMDE